MFTLLRCQDCRMHCIICSLPTCAFVHVEAYLAKILRLIAAKDVKALNAHAKDDLVLR